MTCKHNILLIYWESLPSFPCVEPGDRVNVAEDICTETDLQRVVVIRNYSCVIHLQVSMLKRRLSFMRHSPIVCCGSRGSYKRSSTPTPPLVRAKLRRLYTNITRRCVRLCVLFTLAFVECAPARKSNAIKRDLDAFSCDLSGDFMRRCDRDVVLRDCCAFEVCSS